MTVGPQKICPECGQPFAPKDESGDALRRWRKQKHCSQRCGRLSGRYTPEEAAAAFWEKVDKGPHPKGCWLFTGFIKWDGYGWLSRQGRYMTAHRYSWILANGQPPVGMHILHKCDVPACCNPEHLRLGTHQENMADMHAKGRHNSGFTKKLRPVLHPNRVRPRKQA